MAATTATMAPLIAGAARPGSWVARPTATKPTSAARPNLPYIGLSAGSIRRAAAS